MEQPRQSVQVVIPAAGLGKRMGSITKSTNKALCQIDGKPIIIHSINKFQKIGLQKIFVITGHKSKQICESVNEKAICLFNPFYKTLGILGSILQAKNYLEESAFLFSTSDHFFDIKVLQNLLHHPCEIKILVQKKNRYTLDDSKVIINGDKIVAMGKDISLDETDGEFSGMAYVGAKSSKKFFSELEKFLQNSNPQGYFMDVLMLLSNKHQIPINYITCEENSRIEIDSVSDLIKARKMSKFFSDNIITENIMLPV